MSILLLLLIPWFTATLAMQPEGDHVCLCSNGVPDTNCYLPTHSKCKSCTTPGYTLNTQKQCTFPMGEGVDYYVLKAGNCPIPIETYNECVFAGSKSMVGVCPSDPETETGRAEYCQFNPWNCKPAAISVPPHTPAWCIMSSAPVTALSYNMMAHSKPYGCNRNIGNGRAQNGNAGPWYKKWSLQYNTNKKAIGGPNACPCLGISGCACKDKPEINNVCKDGRFECLCRGTGCPLPTTVDPNNPDKCLCPSNSCGCVCLMYLKGHLYDNPLDRPNNERCMKHQKIEKGGCDNACGSTKVNDCLGICDGSAPNDEQRTRYQVSEINSPGQCKSEIQSRSCKGASLGYHDWSGSYTHETCVVKKQCGSSPGKVNGGTELRTRYRTASVNAPSICRPQEQSRLCDDGTFGPWTGPFAHAMSTMLTCTVKSQCVGNVGNVVHGNTETRQKFGQASVNEPASCQTESQQRTCDDGTFSDWSGTFTYDSCGVNSKCGK